MPGTEGPLLKLVLLGVTGRGRQLRQRDRRRGEVRASGAPAQWLVSLLVASQSGSKHVFGAAHCPRNLGHEDTRTRGHEDRSEGGAMGELACIQ